MTSALVFAICLLGVATLVLALRARRLRRALDEVQARLDAVDAARREGDKRLERFERALPQQLATARRAAVQPLLVLDDHVIRARRAAEEADGAGLREGITILARDVERAWAQAGLERLAPLAGECFDPSVHEAIARIKGGDGEAAVVEQMEQAGFRSGEDLLRPARVVVRVGALTEPAALTEPTLTEPALTEPAAAPLPQGEE